MRRIGQLLRLVVRHARDDDLELDRQAERESAAGDAGGT